MQGCNALVECDDDGVNAGKTMRFGGGFGQGWHFGAVPDLVDAAVTGRFVSTRW